MKKYRLITRSDFDGLVCAVLLKHINIIEDIKFVHPKDMQDGIIDITESDISTNLPYVEGIHMAFDHHMSEAIRNKKRDNHIIDKNAPSAARVLYNYLVEKGHTFPKEWDEMLEAVDKADSANFTKDEVLNPTDWNLLSFVMDARTGLGRFRSFRISNYQLMMRLIDFCANHNIKEILEIEDVKERVELYNHYKDEFRKMISDNSKMVGKVLVINTKKLDTIYPGNRFIKYAMFEEAEISVQVMWGVKKQNTVFAIGKSIINKNSTVNIGEVCLKYGGGGHTNAGTCQIDNEKADEVLDEILDILNNTNIR